MRQLFALAALAAPAAAQWPPNFADTTVASGWVRPVGLTFAADGRMFVWEKGGRVWLVENGVKAAQPFLDLAEEVGDWRDHGLLGFALDPQFLVNGRVYVSYVVDWHHASHFGTPQYSASADEYFHDTIGRVTRFEANAGDGFRSIDYATRSVLLGEDLAHALPICHQSHGVGALAFGVDGTLLVSTGDSASYSELDIGATVSGSTNTALADGILQPKEAVGAWRAQLVDSLCGKLLRLDPHSGDGVFDNPFFDSAAPRAPRSRVWALGLRNPFRFALIPGTGAASGPQRHPGWIVVGDVGWNTHEEFSLCRAAGENFGWPLFEGLDLQPAYAAAPAANLDAPNPLAGGSCADFLNFSDLLVQETTLSPSWPNPCDTLQPLPTSLRLFEHTRPFVEYGHGGLASTGTFNAGLAERIAIDAAGAGVSGAQFDGASPAGVAWCSSLSYPAPWRNTLFVADFVSGWLKSVELDANFEPRVLRDFGAPARAGRVVALAAHPLSGEIHFIDYGVGGAASVRRLEWAASDAPDAVAAPAQSFGPAPLAVQFVGSASSDPEQQALAFHWDFGDGTSSDEPDPLHVFESLEDISAQGSIVARLFELTPPTPLGAGNPDPEVIRDGERPAVGSQDVARQFDTAHGGDQGAFDWIGYAFAAPRTFRRVQFQEGRHFATGGWFDALEVQVFDGAQWSAVDGLAITPAYPGGNGLSFETFVLEFAPRVGTQIRIAGVPGGAAGFISIGELRVFAAPLAPAAPLRFDVTLRVVDPFGNTDQASVRVSTDNTPPQVVITSPLDGGTYAMVPSAQTLPLTAQIADAEHAPGELTCAWRTTLVHDDHTHPEPLDPACASSTVITPLGCDGEAYAYEIELTVTDAAGLSTRAVSRLEPDCCQGGPAPQIYCTAKVNSLGCTPAISFSGLPSLLSGSPFEIRCDNLVSQRTGLLMYSYSAANAAFLGGFRCVGAPARRTPPHDTAGSLTPACDGALSFDFNAWRQSGPDSSLLSGRLVHVQFWQRDGAASFGAGLSDALVFVLCP